MVRKDADVRRLLEKRLGLWQQNQFDLLDQEAERCDRAFAVTQPQAAFAALAKSL